jgi:Family of unknown function (DUF6308)
LPVRRIITALGSPAEGLIADYFDPEGTFAGASFDLFGRNEQLDISSDDLLAVSLLDVPIKPKALRRLLDGKCQSFSRCLEGVPVNMDLWDAQPEHIWAIEKADDWLRTLHGFGPVVASKLLARKRPRIVPVVDSVVLAQLGQPRDAYTSTRRAWWNG